MLRFCMQDYKIYGVNEIDHGSYTVSGKTCVEAQINGVVSRVNLSALDFEDSLSKPKQVTGKRRGRKRKIEQSDDYKVQLLKTMNKSVKQTLITKVGKRLNGDHQTGKRLRKPNSKFSDYIISSNYKVVEDHVDSDSQDSESEDSVPRSKAKRAKYEVNNGKSRLYKSRVKERILSNTDEEDAKQETGLTVDPLDIQQNDDVVHSFLPVYEPTVHYNDEDPEKQTPGTSTTNENAVPMKSDESSVKNVTPVTILSPNFKATTNSPQVYNNVLCMPVILAGNSENDQELALVNQSGDHRWIQIQPKPLGMHTLSTQKLNTTKNMPLKCINKTKHKISESVDQRHKMLKMLSPSRFILIDNDVKYKPTKVSDIDFNKLVRSLKSVKLPAKNWKIRIIVSPQETITEVIFTNKDLIERCVKFSRSVTGGYKITFGKSEVKLLGAPTLQTFDDIADLLEIIHTIPADSHVIEYC